MVRVHIISWLFEVTRAVLDVSRQNANFEENNFFCLDYKLMVVSLLKLNAIAQVDGTGA